MSRNKNRRTAPINGVTEGVVDSVEGEVVDAVEEIVEAETPEQNEEEVTDVVDTTTPVEEELFEEDTMAEPENPTATAVFEDEPQEDPNAIVVPEAEEVVSEEPYSGYETVEVQNDSTEGHSLVDAKVLSAAEGDQNAAYVAMELEVYSKEMALGRYIDERIGGSWQLKLLRILQKVFNNVPADSFNSCMSVLNTWFYENREGLTSDGSMFRFAPGWTASIEEYHAFTRFCSLLKLTCDPKSRASVVKDTNFEYWLEYGLTEAGRDRLLAYFGK